MMPNLVPSHMECDAFTGDIRQRQRVLDVIPSAVCDLPWGRSREMLRVNGHHLTYM